jgi:peptidoglycan/xylan/chitin deacetylase (PgdA/CDA1 family)
MGRRLMSAAQPVASVSLDLDDLWTYLRTRGDPAWESRPSYLPTFLPRVLDLLQRHELRITFFVVGYDATLESNRPHLRAIAERGHEIGNHSFWHECWLQRYSPEQLDEEIGRAHEALLEATGQQATGFRGPGFSWSPQLFEALAKHGYRYDASTLPTFLGPLARLYFLASAKLSPEQRAERAQLFGAARDGFRPNRPYEWRLRSGRQLLEIPVTTVPIIRTPFHLSYLLYLSRWSTTLMRAYLRFALAACRAVRVEPSFLLHPLDLLGGDEVPHLAFFPGMDLTSAQKTQLVDEVLDVLGERFELVTVGEQARRILAGPPVRAAVALAT